MKGISRRNFLRYLGIGSLGFLARPLFPFAPKGRGFRASDVVQCFDENATTGGTINESVVQIMMDESIKTLTGISNVGDAWKSILPDINENCIISIKVNCINYEVSTHPEFVNCIINGLTQMEFGSVNYKRNNIIIWDRFDDELSDAGYAIYDGNDPNTVRCFGSNHSGVGYDATCPLHINGPAGTITKYPSRIMSLMSDYVIDACVLKDHDWAYITLSLKNHYGSIDQPIDYNLHYNHCNPCVPSLNQQIRDVINPNNIQKIFIVDALFGRIEWGPMGSPNCNPKKLIMSLDTVACDYHGQNVINEERVAQGYSTINAPYIREKIVQEMSKETKIIIIDFHAETTAEKKAFGWFIDGKVSLVFGTHTHVQTADESIFPNGTGYITDIGMTGAFDSVIGVKKHASINFFLQQTPQRFDSAKNDRRLNAIYVEIDDTTGKTTKIERIERRIPDERDNN